MAQPGSAAPPIEDVPGASKSRFVDKTVIGFETTDAPRQLNSATENSSQSDTGFTGTTLNQRSPDPSLQVPHQIRGNDGRQGRPAMRLVEIVRFHCPVTTPRTSSKGWWKLPAKCVKFSAF